jgi:uncharacterized membrane protein YkgB
MNSAAFLEKGQMIENLGALVTRFAIVIVLIWIGGMKFTAYEAGAIEGLVASSPFVSWLYSVFSLQMTSNLIGSIEILTGLLLVIGLRVPLLGALGALMAASTFALTSTFLFSAPGWEASLGGFPALSVVPGQFLLKDLVLLGASIWLLGQSLKQL